MEPEVVKILEHIEILKEAIEKINCDYGEQLEMREPGLLIRRNLEKKKYSNIPMNYFWDILNIFRLNKLNRNI